MAYLCIGLFGTCGNSTWRNRFIEYYKKNGYTYFNPQVEDWTPARAKEEARHLANDEIILFPVLLESYGLGSLAETGFSIIQALRFDDRREVVIMIDDHLDDNLMSDKKLAQESLRARALVREHLFKLNLPNVHLVKSLEQMLSLSLFLYVNRASYHDFVATLQ